MKHEFKVTKSKDQTVYTLESATGGSTSVSGIASMDSELGGMQRRNPPGSIRLNLTLQRCRRSAIS
jgi:hypothetical protein